MSSPRPSSIAVLVVVCWTSAGGQGARVGRHPERIEPRIGPRHRTEDRGPIPANAPVGTLEDIYGPSGESFRSALGFRVSEGHFSTGPAQPGFGVAVDDMVVTWREFKLVEDATDCATSGSCATVALDATRFFDSSGLLSITVTDPSPWDAANPVNDCDGNGAFTDPGDDTDCNDDGRPDVTVRVTSAAEPAGEIAVLDRVGSTASYRGTLPFSAAIDVPGVLFVRSAPPFGSAPPLLEAIVTARYDDRDDGTGQPCRNNPDPALWGRVVATATVFLEAGNVFARSFRVADVTGDADAFADTNETVDLFVTVKNASGRPVTNLVAGLATNDPKIDCVLRAVATLALLPAGASAELPPFRFRVAATADRRAAGKTPSDDYAAAFTLAISADPFEVTSSPVSLAIPLDLDVTHAVGPTATFTEGFETGLGFGNFTFQNLDEDRATNALSDGLRCQYNDPDFINSNSYGNNPCYVGFAAGQNPINAWHIHSTAAPDGGRAYLGSRSLHYGSHFPGNPGSDTTMLSQLDAIRTAGNVNLAARVCENDPAADKRACNTAADCIPVGGGPCIGSSPEMSFKHQISLTDFRRTTIPVGQAVDRGVVHVQVEGETTWRKISPFENVYDVRGTDAFSNCMFDPNDDGNDEDSYFDPSDPNRRLGPSSTCYPEAVFGYQGDTDAPFGAGNIGRASDGPGLRGSLGIGTWVETKFDLSRYRGRSIQVRFLFTSIKVGDVVYMQQVFGWNPTADDDGWYIDDVRITGTLGASVPTIAFDDDPNAGLPGCGPACTALTASLAATPSALPAPGHVVTLSAASSSADRCVDGALLFQFWIDGDGNGALGDPADTLLRDFALGPILVDAPVAATRYGVRVRCSSATSGTCSGTTAFSTVSVACPGGDAAEPDHVDPAAHPAAPWWWNVRFADKTTLAWPSNGGQAVRTVRGSLAALRSTGSFGAEICLGATSGTTQADAAAPAGPNAGFYYLLRGVNCNDDTYRTFHPRENPGNPGKRDAEISVPCPRAAGMTAGTEDSP